ncbi:MAG: hypothetical protein GF417_06990 [Candidatus Latescibacteria bacterium]|nr:hypothetical protein [bacterium]MBD3424165.1 hypothetical protein [Candidatus Latescibacterota bacterium]
MGYRFQIRSAGILKLAIAIFFMAAISFMNCGAGDGGKTEVNLLGFFNEQIDSFKDGKKFRGRIESSVAAEELTEETLRAAGAAIKYDTDHVALQSARMLVQLGFQKDPLYHSGIRLLRDELILGTLLESGLKRDGELTDYILETVQSSVPPQHISKFGRIFTDRLESAPDQTLLLIIAKGKITGALKILKSEEVAARISGWEEYRIALAALGDDELEETFIEDFRKANDPEAKAEHASVLGKIGTQKALKALAGEVRTGLIIEMPNVMMKSVRLDIISAMGYNFPEKEFLHDNAITDDQGYARVEQFCEDRFGISWETERPDFLTVQGFPSEPAPE